MQDRPVVVVGAGLAGVRAVETLRRSGYDGRVTLVGDEAELPYDRPPLSKDVLLGSRAPESTTLRPAAHFAALEIELELGRPATGIDLRTREIELGERRLRYGGLVLATGASARRLPELERRENVFLLRTRDEAWRLRQALEASTRVLVVGAGVIGCEVAAGARARGLEVTIVEAAPTAMIRSVGPVMGSVCAEMHRRRGVDIRCATAIAEVRGDRRVDGVVLSDGSTVEPDVVFVGVGVIPNTTWLEDSGLVVADGIVCDATLNAGAPSVYAAGDIARWPNGLLGGSVRCEQWTNAAEQGRHAALSLLAEPGRARPYVGSNYFWSDQHGNRIQFAGSPDAEEVVVVDGAVETERFLAWYRRSGLLVGALGVNEPQLLIKSKLLVERRLTWSEARQELGV
jgi:NADPH-dependent 2,4-dienoyl-CoA reductase/sulfur reductase-like enzyme